jgi:prepilin-type N-terminal cleavage/methylation domain-containing protein
MARMHKGAGFTLIELMIVVTIVGVLAAIALPAYNDYVKRARVSEVVGIFDAIAQGATEYHSVMGYFPDLSYTAENLASFNQDHWATITLQNGSDPDKVRIRAVFNNRLDLTDGLNPGDYGKLEMIISYDSDTGYSKTYDLDKTVTTIEAIFIPTK